MPKLPYEKGVVRLPLISCEGIDGSGKDTVATAIGEKYPDATITSEPTDMWTGRKLRDVLSDERHPPLMDFYMFLVDRANHIENVIRPLDEAGQLVVSNRYADSTRAYQPVALVESGVFESQWLAKDFIEKAMRPLLYEPDLTIYLDISVETALDRADCDEKYETRETLQRVRANYEALAETKDRIVRVNAEREKEAVCDDVLHHIDRKL